MSKVNRQLFADFSFEVPKSAIVNLDNRLSSAAVPLQSPGPAWSRGIPADLLERLLDTWKNDFSWRLEEERLASEVHLRYRRDNVDLHLVERPQPQTDGLPLLALHGWPYTYAQLLPLADELHHTRPVIIPSLPGFVHSAPLTQPFQAQRVAEIMHTMMADLGYERYFVYGEDIGAPICDWIAGLYPNAVAGIIASHPSFSAQSRPGVDLTSEEQEFFERTHNPDESGYAHLQATRPDTLTAALLDSPLGLLAWITEKIAAWSEGGTANGIENFRTDEILSLVSHYWFTQSIGTSFRSYSEPTDFDDHPIIETPAAILVNTHESTYPRSLADKSHTDIRTFTRLQTGGHFTSWENPRAIANAVEQLAALVNP